LAVDPVDGTLNYVIALLLYPILKQTSAVFVVFLAFTRARRVGPPGYFDSKLMTARRAPQRSVTQQSVSFSLHRPAAARAVVAFAVAESSLSFSLAVPSQTRTVREEARKKAREEAREKLGKEFAKNSEIQVFCLIN
jgi:hypothetical protein